MQDLIFVQQVVGKETDDTVSILLPEIENDLDTSARKLQSVAVSHRNVLHVDYHEWRWVRNFTLLWCLLRVLSLPRVIITLLAEPQVGGVEDLLLAWEVMLVRLLAAITTLHIIAVFGPIL